MTPPLGRIVTSLGQTLGIDMRYLLSGGFWLTVGQVTSSLSVFLLALAFTNLVSKDFYGTYKYFISIAGLFSIFTLPGIGTALLRAVARGYDGSLRAAMRIRMRWALIGTLVALGAAGYYAYMQNGTLAAGLVVIALFLPFTDIANSFGAYLQGKQQFRTYIALGALVQITSIACVIVALVLSHHIIVIIVTYFAAYTLLRFGALRYVERHFPARGGVDPELTSYGKHLTAMSVLSIIAGQADTLLTFHFLGATQVAIYAVAIAGPDQIKNITGSVGDLLFPRFAKRTEQEIRTTMLAKCLMLGGVMILVIGAYIVLAPWLFSIFFSQYMEAVWYSQLFVLSMLNAFFSPYVVYLQAQGKVREQYYLNTISALVQIAAMVVGILSAGLLGLIMARIVVRYINGLLAAFLFYRPFAPLTTAV